MTAEQAIESEIAAIEHRKQRLLKALAALRDERPKITQPIASRIVGGEPPQWAMLRKLTEGGVSASDLKTAFEKERGRESANPSYQATLSKAKGGGAIHKRADGLWYPGRDEAAGQAEQEQPAADHSNQEGGDGHAANNMP